MPSLHGRVGHFYTDLNGYREGAQAGSAVVAVYNTLLSLAQNEHQGDAVLSRMSELSGTFDAVGLRVLTGQILAALSR